MLTATYYDTGDLWAEGDTLVTVGASSIFFGDLRLGVLVGGIRINANDDESTMHIFRDVRLRGEALSREKRGIRATFISTNKADPNGYRYVWPRNYTWPR